MSTTENIRYLIDAEDRASAKFREVGAALAVNIGTIKEYGAKVKTSTELTGALASVLGGSQFGATAGQIAGLTEKVSSFSEVAKSGGAGMMAFKLGVVAAAGAIAYNLAHQLTAMAIGLEEVQRNAENAKNALSDMTNRYSARLKQQLALETELATLRGDEQYYLQDLEKKIKLKQHELEFARDMAAIESDDEKKKQAEGEIETLQMELGLYRDQANAIKDRNDPLRQKIELQKQENAEIEKGEQYLRSLREEYEKYVYTEEEQARNAASRATANSDQFDEAVRLQEQIASAKAAKEEELRIAEEKKKLEQEEIKRQQDLAKLYNDQVASLEMQAVKLLDGDKAARVMQLTMQGMSEEQATQIANLEEQLNALGEQEKKTTRGATNNAATESRLLAGRANIGADPALAEAKKANELAAKREETLRELLAEIRAVRDNTAGGIQVETVG